MGFYCQMRLSVRILSVVVLALVLLVFSSSPSSSQLKKDYTYDAYKLYFRWHPPKKMSDRDLYPYHGRLIRRGEDRPVCAAAKNAESYSRFKAKKFLMHGKDGWLFRTIDFQQDFPLTPKALNYFVRLNKQLAEQGQKLVILFVPPRAMLEGEHIDTEDMPIGYTTEKTKENYRGFLKKMNDAGIPVIGISEVPAGMDYFQEGDAHWSLSGVDYTAKQLAYVIKKIPSYNVIKKQEFQSEIISLAIPKRGGFEDVLQDICGINIQIRSFPQWATTRKVGDVLTADDLLGDVSFPEITVLGTSYTAQDNNFNFVGSLKRYLNADIYNAALVGGGFGGASYRYYASDEYHAYPPKIILWEILSMHKHNTEGAEIDFRQMIPAIQGACSKNEAIVEYSGDITDTTTEIFDEIRGMPLKNTYLYFKVTDPVDRKLQIQILYADGNADDIDMSRSTFIANNGKYYLEMGGVTDKPAIFFHIKTDKPQGHLTARLCRYSKGRAGK